MPRRPRQSAPLPLASKLTAQQVQVFIERCHDPQDRALLALTYLTACNIPTAVQLRVSDIRIGNFTPSNGKSVKIVTAALPAPERKVYFLASEPLFKPIVRLIKTRPNAASFIFDYLNKRSYGRFNPSDGQLYIQARLHPFLNKRVNLGQPLPLTFGLLRKARAFYWGQVCGFTLPELRSCLGWKIRSPVERYLKPQPARMLSKLVAAAEENKIEV